MQTKALRADVLMLITAMIWGSGFVAQTSGMDHIGPFLYSGLRFALGSLCLLPLVLRGNHQNSHHEPFLTRGLLIGGGLMGLALALGINLQQVGLLFTSVTNAGFITGLYVIVVPLLGWLAVSHYGPFEPFGIRLPTLAAQDEAQATRTFFLHKVGACSLIVLIGMHVGAALQHYLIRKDGVLRRMWVRAGRLS